jgi:hypothetical protein
MVWFKVDDSFYRSAKVRKLGKRRVSAQSKVAATGLWTLSGDWSADNLTDGFIPWEVIEEWDPDRNLAGRLLDCGLWVETERDGEPGCQFHDWGDWQPTRDQVVQRRKADTERRARWREAKRSNGGGHAVTVAETEPASRQESRRDAGRESPRESRPGSALPDPTRPDPLSTSRGDVESDGSCFVADEVETSRRDAGRDAGLVSPPAGGRATRGTRIPDDFEVTPAMVTWSRENTPHADGRVETDQFRDYWHAKSGKDATKIDWEATWRSWMRNAEKHAGRTNGAARNGATRIPTTQARVDAIEALRRPGDDS